MTSPQEDRSDADGASPLPLPVRPGDRVLATGRIVVDSGSPMLVMVGRGVYDRDASGAGDYGFPVDLSSVPDADQPVTIEGTWTGARIEDARLVASVEPLAPPEFGSDSLDPAIVPTARRPKAELLAPPVAEAVDRLRAEGLLYYTIARAGGGWVAIVCAAHPEPVVRALEPLIGDACTVVPVDWTAADIDRASDALDVAEREGHLLMTGAFMDPRGEFRAWGLVAIVTPELDAALAGSHPGAMHLDAWITRAR